MVHARTMVISTLPRLALLSADLLVSSYFHFYYMTYFYDVSIS